MRGTYGVIGFFKDPNDIVEAVKKVRERGYRDLDTYSPYPIHGMDAAMGLGRSWLPWVTFIMGATGAISAFAFQSWTSGAIDLWPAWPLIIGGKPFWSIPAFIPITFEWTILFGAHATALTMIVANGLPNLKNPVLSPRVAERVTSDECGLMIFSKDSKFNEQECLNFLSSLGAIDVQVVREDD